MENASIVNSITFTLGISTSLLTFGDITLTSRPLPAKYCAHRCVCIFAAVEIKQIFMTIDNKYILIGRGIYALKDWGYQKGTVVDIIKQVLVKAGKLLTKEEIVEQVLKQRMVGKGTVQLALANKECFAKTEDGKYQLV